MKALAWLASARREPLVCVQVPKRLARFLLAAGAQPAPVGLTVAFDNASLARRQRMETLIFNHRQPPEKRDPATCPHPERAILGGRCILCGTEGLGR